MFRLLSYLLLTILFTFTTIYSWLPTTTGQPYPEGLFPDKVEGGSTDTMDAGSRSTSDSQLLPLCPIQCQILHCFCTLSTYINFHIAYSPNKLLTVFPLHQDFWEILVLSEYTSLIRQHIFKEITKSEHT